MAIQESTECAPEYVVAHDHPLGGRSKRFFDLVAAFGALVFLAPLLLAVAVFIYFSGRGPVLIRHRRIGFGGQWFDCLKFRTMVTDGDRVLRDHLATDRNALEEWTASRKLVNDPRVTKLGRVLRKTSLDELPQLCNIFAGDMSFVGPRPIVMEEIQRYGSAFSDYARARPGLTGRWQVSGRSDTSYDQRVALDQEYVTDWSFFGDVKILLVTIPAVIKAKGVY